LAARILAGCTDANPTARWHSAKAILETPWLRFWPGISDSLQALQSDAILWVQRAATLASSKPQKGKQPVAKAPPAISKTFQQPVNACEKIPFDNNDLPKIQGILQDWNLHVKQYAGMARHDGQRFIEPYVLQRRQSGYLVNFLVATADAQVWYDHVYPWIDIDIISQFNMIEPGAVVFDLGANHGFYSVLFAKMAGSKGRVYAFEPFPVMGDVIKFNARLNDVRIDVYDVGLSKEKKDATASLTAQCIALDQFGDSVKISLDSLDNYGHLVPSFLKIDIEGAEIDALEGAKKLLEHRPNIYLEVHTSFLKHFGRRVEEIFEVLPLSDYFCYVMAPGKPLLQFNGELDIEEHFSLFLLKESPVRKVAA
jgi:FkbM family methyltransferase